MTSRDGRQILERVLERLNYARVIDRDPRYTFAWLEASEICCEIIRNWNKRQPLSKWLTENFFTRKAAA